MAKLRDTAVKDNLNIAGSVVANGKVLSVEGHTHTPANITGLDTYINQRIQAAGGGTGGGGTPVTPTGDINAKTLDGHPVSDFVLKTESTTTTTGDGTVYSYKKTLKFTSPTMQITIPESISGATIKVTDKFSTKTFKKNNTYNQYLPTMELFDFPDRELYNYSAYVPTYCVNNNIIAISGLSHDELKITIEVLSITPITEDIKISTDISIGGWRSFNIDKISFTNLGYTIYDANKIVFTPPKGLRTVNSKLEEYNTLCLYGDVKILDLDNNLTVRTYNGSLYSYNPDNVQYKSARIYSKGVAMYFISGLSKNIIVKSNYGIVYYDTSNISSNATPSRDSADNAEGEYNLISMKKLVGGSNSSGGTISATINGVQFDGKTNITTPASKLITPVHINGVEFDGSRDITIPAPTNALTLGGLDSSQYIKATDVGNAAGKIPKFDNDGFLVYPDGSKERIENA